MHLSVTSVDCNNPQEAPLHLWNISAKECYSEFAISFQGIFSDLRMKIPHISVSPAVAGGSPTTVTALGTP